MPAFKLTIEYDGTHFHGWQAQQGQRTVEGVLLDVLRGLGGERAALQGASRTDSGVHATGQVAAATLDLPWTPERLARVLNEKLPGDVYVVAVEAVAPTFDARFDAVGKHYRYLVCCQGRAGAFLSRYALAWRAALDDGAMSRAASLLIGEHDFASFQVNSGEERASTVRRLDAVRVTRHGALLAVDVWGTAFLYRMVRTLAGTLLEVGRGRLAPQALSAILRAADRRSAGPTAAAHGLTLVEVFFDRARYQQSCGVVSGTPDWGFTGRWGRR